MLIGQDGRDDRNAHALYIGFTCPSVLKMGEEHILLYVQHMPYLYPEIPKIGHLNQLETNGASTEYIVYLPKQINQDICIHGQNYFPWQKAIE